MGVHLPNGTNKKTVQPTNMSNRRTTLIPRRMLNKLTNIKRDLNHGTQLKKRQHFNNTIHSQYEKKGHRPKRNRPRRTRNSNGNTRNMGRTRGCFPRKRGRSFPTNLSDNDVHGGTTPRARIRGFRAKVLCFAKKDILC